MPCVQVSLVMSAKHGGKSVVPQQRMLRFTSLRTKAAAYFNLKPSKLKDHTYTITVTSSSVEKQTGGQVRSGMHALCCMPLHLPSSDDLAHDGSACPSANPKLRCCSTAYQSKLA